jgi:thiol-disulfide isomerase/thioredoxin
MSRLFRVYALGPVVLGYFRYCIIHQPSCLYAACSPLGCAHCQALQPHWAEVAARFNGPGGDAAFEAEKLTVVSVDAVANPVNLQLPGL